MNLAAAQGNIRGINIGICKECNVNVKFLVPNRFFITLVERYRYV